MKITWLGQAGLMFETRGKTILVDPYLSDSVAKIEPKNVRRVPVKEDLLSIRPDVVLCTHDHLDHIDPETLDHYLKTPGCLVLAPIGGYKKLRGLYGPVHNYIWVTSGLRWTEGDITFRAVPASHSDPDAVGYILSAEGKNYYITGDTLYHEGIFAALPDLPLEAVFLPINGVGNNMNAADASDFALRTGAKYAVPLHFGLFDSLSPESFTHPRRVIPEFYKEIVLP
ncbi:MAG: MBL fold metallo-hydrolase [Clostridia bacterium]|nr:MBL fold metallo-hydrolase [Clostridia bacterium]